MAEPPQPVASGQDFRTLPEHYAQRDEALVSALLREVRARQEMVRSLLETEDEAVQLPFVDSFDRHDGADALANKIIRTLSFDLQDFRRGQRPGAPKGFAYLRERVEAAGIFVLLIGNLGSHHSALGLGLSIPNDVSIVGFDDLRTVSHALKSELTTAALPYYDLGYSGAERLERLLEGEDLEPKYAMLSCRLVERGSVGAV